MQDIYHQAYCKLNDDDEGKDCTTLDSHSTMDADATVNAKYVGLKSLVFGYPETPKPLN